MMENIKYWDEVKDYFFITLGIMLYTISFTVFLMPYQIVAGGVTGLSATWGAKGDSSTTIFCNSSRL